ncbi:MAG: hypothetical protein ABI824_15335 [Acidobacteriota bacterium]
MTVFGTGGARPVSNVRMKDAGDTGNSAWVTFRYWGVLAAKLAVLLVLLKALDLFIVRLIPPPPKLFNVVREPPLSYMILILAFWLLTASAIFAVTWDHRLRCRTCLRRLRMPVTTGSWKNVLFSRPRTEYICPYGHGTLKIEDLQITGHSEPDWEANEDIWKELISLDKASQLDKSSKE